MKKKTHYIKFGENIFSSLTWIFLHLAIIAGGVLFLAFLFVCIGVVLYIFQFYATQEDIIVKVLGLSVTTLLVSGLLGGCFAKLSDWYEEYKEKRNNNECEGKNE